jgi:DNA-binding winged helix-turn-helix (wHTH) protein
MTRPPKHLYEFGHFCLDATERLLLRQGAPVSLTPKVFETLLVLAQNSGRLMEKDELMKVLWPDTIVDEANLTQNIFVLRKVLGEGSGEQKFIETVPKRGYRFVANVTERWEEETRAEDRESRIEDRESRIED